jgi:hypothetical protein
LRLLNPPRQQRQRFDTVTVAPPQRSAADALARHVVFELECIDRVYFLYVPKLQRELGVVGFIREHLGKPVASTAGELACNQAADQDRVNAGLHKVFSRRSGPPSPSWPYQLRAGQGLW